MEIQLTMITKPIILFILIIFNAQQIRPKCSTATDDRFKKMHRKILLDQLILHTIQYNTIVMIKQNTRTNTIQQSVQIIKKLISHYESESDLKKLMKKASTLYLLQSFKIKPLRSDQAETLYYKLNDRRKHENMEVQNLSASDCNSSGGNSLDHNAHSDSQWLKNQRKLFLWYLICYSQFHKIEINEVDEESWQIMGQLFFRKNPLFLKFQGLSIYKTSKRHNWNANDDRLLEIYVKQLGNSCWNEISKAIFFHENEGRFISSKQCRERWYNHLNKQINKSEWNIKQDIMLLRHWLQNGNKWSKISKLMDSHRTEHMVKNRFLSILNKNRQTKKQNEENVIKKVLEDLQLQQLQKEKQENEEIEGRDGEDGNKEFQSLQEGLKKIEEVTGQKNIIKPSLTYFKPRFTENSEEFPSPSFNLGFQQIKKNQVDSNQMEGYNRNGYETIELIEVQPHSKNKVVNNIHFKKEKNEPQINFNRLKDLGVYQQASSVVLHPEEIFRLENFDKKIFFHVNTQGMNSNQESEMEPIHFSSTPMTVKPISPFVNQLFFSHVLNNYLKNDKRRQDGSSLFSPRIASPFTSFLHGSSFHTASPLDYNSSNKDSFIQPVSSSEISKIMQSINNQKSQEYSD